VSNQHSGFGKVHEKLFASSLMRNDVETRWVFVFLFSCCGSDGRYVGDSFAIARHANVPEESVKRALTVLTDVDPLSSSPEFDGRRIADVSDGHTGSEWLVLNHKKYRARRDPAERAAYNAAYYQSKAKARRAAGRKVRKSNGVRPIKPIAEAEAEAEKRERAPLSQASPLTGGPTPEEWGERAKREHPDWPESDVRRSLRIAPHAKGWPKGWEARQDTLHERYLEHPKGTMKTPSPADREKAELKRTIQKAKGIHIPAPGA